MLNVRLCSDYAVRLIEGDPRLTEACPDAGPLKKAPQYSDSTVHEPCQTAIHCQTGHMPT